MSLRSARSNSSYKLKEQANRKLAIIVIKILEVKNLEFLVTDSATQVEIVAEFMNDQIKCKINEKQNSARFRSSDEEIHLSYELQIDIDNEENVYDLFANPVHCKFLLTIFSFRMLIIIF